MLGFYPIAAQPISGSNLVLSGVTIVGISGISHYGQAGISKKTVNTTTGAAVATVYDVRADSVTEHSYLVNGSIV